MSNRDLLNFKKRVFNTPQLITPDDFQPIVDYMIDPQRTEFKPVEKAKILTRADFSKDEEYRKYKLESLDINPETMQGIIKIEGTLVNRAGQIQACVELTSYEGIKKKLSAQIEMGVKEVVMLIDSGGGEAYGMFATAAKIRKMADDADIKLIAYVDGYACSAAYGLASAAHEIIANPQAIVGSVGVVVQLLNNSKALKKAGYSRTFIYAGENKIPFDESGEWDKEFLTSLQASVNKTYKRFTNLIAINRGMQEKDVVKTQASTYDADEAVAVGFVDKLMEVDEFFDEYLPSLQQNNTTQNLKLEENMDKDEMLENLVQLDADTQTVISLEELKTLQEKASKLDEISTSLATANADLLASQAKIAELQDEILSAKADAIITARRAKLVDVLGSENEQVASILTATADLKDDAFDIVLGSYSATFKAKEEKMVEVGLETQKEQPRMTLEERIAKKLKEARNA